MGILIFFPLVNFIHQKELDEVISTMEKHVEIEDTHQIESLLENANAYNENLAGKKTEMPKDRILAYDKQLIPEGESGNPPFGSVIIPKLNLYMPIFKTANNAVLSAGAGHIEGTSLPIGGDSTHTCISAHSGMPNQAAFDNIRLLDKGDVFGFKVLNKLVTYEVECIEVVEPDQFEKLEIIPGKDLATLVTCTPYGINSHRLLVTGHRIPVPANFEKQPVSIKTIVKDRRNLPLFIGIFIVLVMLFLLLFKKKRR